MKITNHIDRRSFLKVSTAAGGGLLLGLSWLTSCVPEESAEEGVDLIGEATDFTEMNAYLKVATNGVVTIMATNPEIGQNIKTALPMIVAEELDIPWSKVIVEQAPLNDVYPRQVAGGSRSVRSMWEPLREAGATARQLLINAAAQEWQVDAAQCTTDGEGYVVHPDGSQKRHYGELVATAAQMEVPEEVTLKDPADFNLLGQRIPNVDNHAIVTGQPLFGRDTKREGMLFAMVVRPPAFGQKLKSVDDSAARNVPGVVDVIPFDDDKVAVLATSTWRAKKGRDALRLNWEDPARLDDTQWHDEELIKLLDKKPDEPKRKDGNAEAAMAGAAKVVEGFYEAPFLPHNPMAPLSFFAHVKEDSAELYGPTQVPASARRAAADALGIPQEKITVGMSRQGGGFGRRLRNDFVLDAVKVSQLAKAPVQMIWTREDDMTAGIYRPASKYRYRAGLDENGNLIAWHLRSAGISTGNATLPNNFPAGSVPNFQVDYNELESHVTTGPWRAPTHNFVAYAEESFVDEIAHAAGKDPVAFRLELLDKAQNDPTGEVDYEIDRYRAVIEKARDMAGWGQPKGEGIAQGFAAHFSYGSYVAQVAEVSIENGNIKVHKVYCAVDCGIIINRSGAEQQIEGGIIDGLGHAMYAEQTLRNGVPVHRNFDTYHLIRINEVPEVVIEFIESNKKPEGLGEPGLPPIGGAVANAVFKATGVRLRKQPFVQSTLLG